MSRPVVVPPLDPASGAALLFPGLWRIALPDPFVPHVTAAFLIEAGEWAWLFDVGADTAECEAALEAGLESAGRPRETLSGALLSHTHLDHAGGLFRWSPPALVVHREAEEEMRSPPRSSRGPAALRRMGVPQPEIALLAPHGEPVGERPLPARLVTRELTGSTGELPEIPGWGWLLAGGHAPGHILLHHPGRRVLLAGDQFLERWKTPYVISDPEADSFGAYLGSVDAVLALRPGVLVPSHTTEIAPAVPWLEERRATLERMRDRTAAALRTGARTANEAVARLYPSTAPGGLKVILLREQLAVLRHLAAAGAARREVEAGVERFFPIA